MLLLLLLLLHDSIHAIVKRLNVTTTRDSRCGRRNKRDLEIPSRFSCSASNSIKSMSLSLYLSILLAFSFEARASVCKRVAPNRHQDTVCPTQDFVRRYSPCVIHERVLLPHTRKRVVGEKEGGTFNSRFRARDVCEGQPGRAYVLFATKRTRVVRGGRPVLPIDQSSPVEVGC